MAKRKRIVNIDKFLKEGRGQYTLENYKTWITIQDVPSLGRVTRLKGIKTKRQHELLSDLERDYFYYLDFSSTVVDIREQFPLLPIEETILIAKELGIEHPKNPKTQVNIVMTTDFLITINQNNKFSDIARTIKYKDDLLNKRVIEKFEIERKYWEQKGVDWGIVTEQEINKNVALNISSIHNYFFIKDLDSFINMDKDTIDGLISSYLGRLINDNHSIRMISKLFDEDMGLLSGTGLSFYKHLFIKYFFFAI